MKSEISGIRFCLFVITSLAIVLAGPACSQTPKQMPITTGDGGWEHVYNGPQGAWIYALHFVDGKTGWAVGGEGLILKTTNGGATWSPQISGINNRTLASVWFTDANNGCIVGYDMRKANNGIILTTTDGGATWTAQAPPEKLNLYSVCFTDAKTGFAVGVAGPVIRVPKNEGCKLLKTIDGGATWNIASSNVPLEKTFQIAASFGDAEHGCAVDYCNLVRTADGGKTWRTPATVPKGTFASVCMVDGNNGWACGADRHGRAMMLRTTDGGDTWTRQTTGMPETPPGSSFHCVHFTDRKNGWASGDGGTIVRTTDGGETWTAAQTATGLCLLAVRFGDATNGCAAGWDGVMFHTTDGGKTWISPQPRTLRGVNAEFINSRTGWITGSEGGILKTTDGGLTWVQQRPNGPEWLGWLGFADEKNGWAVGPYGDFVVTNDGGDHWLRGPSWLLGLSKANSGVPRAQRIDADYGYLLVEDWTDRDNWIYAVRRTTDGGKTWNELSTGTLTPIWDMWFLNRKVGYLVGWKGVCMKTTDGGNTWKRKFTGSTKGMAAVRFVDSKVGWIVGQEGLMLKSSDGGETWTKQASVTKDDLWDLEFLDASAGWVSSGSRAWRTIDGGNTWTPRETGAGRSHIRFTDRDHGWIAGGSLLRTTTGGLPGCMWAKKQQDGKAANFGHLVVTETTSDGIYAVHPDSKIGIRIRMKDPQVKDGDYIYVHGKIASDGAEKVIGADSIDVITAGWGLIDPEGLVASR